MWENRDLGVTNEDPFRIVTVGVRMPDGPGIALVGRPMGGVNNALETEVGLLAIGLPIVLVLVAAATGWFVGRSLRAVESVRRRVASISTDHLHERVPVPAARDEIRELALTMNAMLDRLEAGASAQRRFVADASHELSSPLSTLRVGLELLRARIRRGAAPEAESLELLQAETERLHRLVRDLLLLARADENGLRRRRAEVDLDDVVGAEARRLVTHAGLRVDVDLQPARVTGDAEQLARVVRNLVDNAAAHATTRMAITLSSDGWTAYVRVADDGAGIADADKCRVFDRFVRLDESRERRLGGSGLGLAIVAEIVSAHGGSVAITDTPGGGATVQVSLPADGPGRELSDGAQVSGR
jgi:signal transduction histidine kinase